MMSVTFFFYAHFIEVLGSGAMKAEFEQISEGSVQLITARELTENDINRHVSELVGQIALSCLNSTHVDN